MHSANVRSKSSRCLVPPLDVALKDGILQLPPRSHPDTGAPCFFLKRKRIGITLGRILTIQGILRVAFGDLGHHNLHTHKYRKRKWIYGYHKVAVPISFY
jgi:hypothetical protein